MIKNQDGFQLVEVLLAIALISILLLTFSGFFQQANLFTAKNEASGSAVQLSQEILQKVKASSLQQSPTVQDWNALYGTSFAAGEEFSQEINGKLFFPVVTLSPASQVDLNAIKVEIWTQERGSKEKVYETYGYKERN